MVQIIEDQARAAVKRLYRRRADWYDLIFVRLIGRAGSLKQFLERYAHLPAGGQVLDAGTGSGLLIRLLLAIAADRNLAGLVCHGFDFTPAMLERARRALLPSADHEIILRETDALKLGTLPADWRDYHLIVSAGLLEYLPPADRQRVLAELATRLRPDGQFFLFITRRNWLTKLVVKNWWQADIFTRSEFKEMLAAAGLKYVFRRFPRLWSNWGTLAVEISQ